MASNKMSGSLNHAMIDGTEAKAAQAMADRFGEPGYDDITKVYIAQNYAGYTEENQETWRILYDRQMAYLADHASALDVPAVRAKAHLGHLEQDAPLHGLQTVR